jgi:NAD(P)-dependent dehydrogenase (short-subunit alcohol dehydrogenase family)
MSKTVIITGANGNLGIATVKKFLESGYHVIAIDHAVNHLEFAIGNMSFEWYAVDLADENGCASFISNMIQIHSRIDAVLMLAGGFAAGDVAATGAAELRKMYALNFETAYFIARPLFSHMLQNNYGRLVFIGARPALKAGQGKNLVAYALSKSLLFDLAELLNAEAKGKNIVASVVAPSTIDTPLNRQSMPDADPSDWVTPAQIADVLEFICSDKGLPLREPVYKLYNNA